MQPTTDTLCSYSPEQWSCPALTKVTAEGIQAMQVRARELCGECPLLRHCADYALLQADLQGEKWQGVVIAGVAVPAANHRSAYCSAVTLQAIDAVRRGVPLEDVHAAMEPAPLRGKHQQLAHRLNRAWKRDTREHVGR